MNAPDWLGQHGAAIDDDDAINVNPCGAEESCRQWCSEKAPGANACQWFRTSDTFPQSELLGGARHFFRVLVPGLHHEPAGMSGR